MAAGGEKTMAAIYVELPGLQRKRAMARLESAGERDGIDIARIVERGYVALVADIVIFSAHRPDPCPLHLSFKSPQQ